MFKLEIIGFNIESCSIAQSAGAARIELCDNAAEGGTTPSYGYIKKAREILYTELFPIIRPRGGDFLYSDEEFEMMKTDVLLCKQLGCDGIVTGMLQRDGSIDKIRCSKLISLAYPMGVTFHRAFDRCNDPFKSLEDIIDTGCERILTSGQQPAAVQGAGLIQQLAEQADGRIIIMPGSGINSSNIKEIAIRTGATEFHASVKTIAASRMQYVNPSMKEQPASITADANEIKEMVIQLQHLQE
ncbi:MAG: copper homeostasis protein CutC [Ferruginibacter sp.]